MGTQINDRSRVFIDTETTGLDPVTHEIIEIAAVVEDSIWAPLHIMHRLVRPERIETASVDALRINGYEAEPEKWADALTLKELAPELATHWKGGILVGHNVGFDRSFILRGFTRVDEPAWLPYHLVDTVTLAYEHLVPLGLTSLSLASICDFLKWSREGEHTALRDAMVARRLYWLLCHGIDVGDSNIEVT